MCGIFFLLPNKYIPLPLIYESFNKIKRRGPDQSVFEVIKQPYSLLGFHRLSIMDIKKGIQPFIFKDDERTVYTVCNGEIYNHKKLIEEHSLITKTTSDCEVIIALYLKYGMKKTVSLLDGEFAFIIVEIKEKSKDIKVLLSRDPYGVRPMFYSYSKKGFFVSSEIKAIKSLNKTFKIFPPGFYMKVKKNESKNNISRNFTRYFNYSSKFILNYDFYHSDNASLFDIEEILTDSVRKRLASNRPIGCLLSGGLDSSIICAITAKLLSPKKLKTFTIGFEGSSDIKFAEIVAKYIDSDHTTFIITPKEAFSYIEETIYAIESYDTTTVRASIFQLILGKKISQNSDVKVLLTGEGSDEVTSGYLYNYFAPSLKDLHNEAVKRLSEIHKYDGLRVDRAMAWNGLEVRIPFLDPKFVETYLNIHPRLRIPCDNRMEKYFLRMIFLNYLPDKILFRRKEAFSDGVSTSKEILWYQVLQNHIDKIVSDEEYEENRNNYKYNKPDTKEKYYYRKIWEESYGKADINHNIIPKFWMPKWVDKSIKDPSASVLSIY